jgi:hypothetical protein
MKVVNSRYSWTPGCDGTHFGWKRGEVVQVRSSIGAEPLRVRIDSDLMSHPSAPGYVFECVALESRPESDIYENQRYALDAARIEPTPDGQREIMAGRVSLGLSV